MFNLFIFMASIFLATATSVSPTSEVQKFIVIDSDYGRLGKLSIEMSKEDILSLNLAVTKKSVTIEGDEYDAFDVKLSDDISISCIFDEKDKIQEISTTSKFVRDERGISVGTPLANVKNKYPDGRFLYGDEDGRYASFLNGSKVMFSFDINQLDEKCYNDHAKDCLIDNDRVFVSKIVLSRDLGK